MGFLSKLARHLKVSKKKSRTNRTIYAVADSPGIEQTPSITVVEPTLPAVGGTTPSDAAGIGEGDKRLETGSLYPPSATTPGPSSASVSINEGHAETTLRSPNEYPPQGFFHNTKRPVFNNPTMIDKSTTVTTTVITGESVAMRMLSSHTDPNAAVDSGAREPVPTCHPKTRFEIRQKLDALFRGVNKSWMMLWLFGAAGTGKTAVGQTFSSECDERGELGAAFFFSRPNGRNKYETVIPTLAYQLAIHCPPYRSTLTTRIDHDQQIFDKKRAVQFKKLIVEPLLEVQHLISKTFLMLLDGLDECGANMENAFEREREQCELVMLIAKTVRDHPDLPLFWLLCSRPEGHLQDAFAGITAVCRREDLVIDAQCRGEVEVVLREGFADVAMKRRVVTPDKGPWPSEDDFNTVECAVAGLHVFGAAILKDIEHSTSPDRQLKSLIPFLKRVAGAGKTGSIQVMDLFYTRILGDVPGEDLPTTMKIIGILITMPSPEKLPAQALCNFMQLDPNDFSSALRMIHSVVNVPPPEKIHSDALHLYHASFSDFLTDTSRSGPFFVDKKKVLVDLIKTCFYWEGLHSNTFHSSDQAFYRCGWEGRDNHGPLPNLKWTQSATNKRDVSITISRYANFHRFSLFQHLDQPDEELLSLIYNHDFRHISGDTPRDTVHFLRWVLTHDPLRAFIRTEPNSDEERRLLTYAETLTNMAVVPASLPPDWRRFEGGFSEYVFLGWGPKTIIIWNYLSRKGARLFTSGLNLDRKPTKEDIQRYNAQYQGAS